MANAQEWLDKYYPKEGTCIRKKGDEDDGRKEDWNNKGKKKSRNY